MKTITHTGGTTYDGTTNVAREVPMIKNFPLAKGKAQTVKVQTTISASSDDNTNSYTMYLFKTFNYAGDWDERTDNMYQYPNNGSYYVKTSYIADVLASASFTEKIAGSVVTKTLTLTDYGKEVENWAGTVYLAIVKTTDAAMYWGNGKTSTIILEYNNGIIKYATGGEFVDCEVYLATDGSFQQVQPYFGADGAFKEIGG